MEYKVCACACVHECKCIMSHDHECGNESGEESSHRSPGVRRTMSAYGTFNIKKLDNGMETWHVKTVATRREKISDLPPESARLPGLALGPARVSGGRSVITSRNICSGHRTTKSRNSWGAVQKVRSDRLLRAHPPEAILDQKGVHSWKEFFSRNINLGPLGGVTLVIPSIGSARISCDLGSPILCRTDPLFKPAFGVDSRSRFAFKSKSSQVKSAQVHIR